MRAASSARSDDVAVPAFDFNDIGARLEKEPTDTETWPGLRNAAQWALKQGKLDTYLWWRYAANARKLLRARAALRAGDIDDAVAVVAACARARVQPSTGVYTAWARALTRSSPEGCQASFGVLARTALAFAQASAQLEDSHFWTVWLPSALQARVYTCTAADLAMVAATYAIAQCLCSQVMEIIEQTVLSGYQTEGASWLRFEPRDAALLLWGHRQGGHLHALVFRQLWSCALDQHLSELSPMQMVAVIDYAAALREAPRDSDMAQQLVLNLQRRMESTALALSPQMLCRALHSLSAAAMVEPQEVGQLVQGLLPALDTLGFLACAELLCVLAHLRISDIVLLEALVGRIAVTAFVVDVKAVSGNHPHASAGAFVADMALEPVLCDRLTDPRDICSASLVALEGLANLSESQTKFSQECPAADVQRKLCNLAFDAVKEMPRPLEVYNLAAVATCIRAAWVLGRTAFTAEDEAQILRTLQEYLCQLEDDSFPATVGDVSDMEAVLRISAALPLASCKASVDLVDACFGKMLSQGCFSPSLLASFSFSMSLLSKRTSQELRRALQRSLRQLSSSELLLLCLGSLLESSCAPISGATSPDANLFDSNVSIDWLWLMSLLGALGDIGIVFHGAEGLLVQLIEILHNRSRSGASVDDRPSEWPSALRHSVGSFRSLQIEPPSIGALAATNAEVRLSACLQHLLDVEDADDSHAGVHSLETKLPVAVQSIGVLRRYLRYVEM